MRLLKQVLLLTVFFCPLLLTPELNAQSAWVTGSSSGVALYTMELGSTAVGEVGTIDLEGASPLTRAPGGGFFAISGALDRMLYRIDIDPLSTTIIGPLGLTPADLIAGLTTDDLGRLWLSTEDALYEINTTTGQAAQVGLTSRPLRAIAAYGDRLLGISPDPMTDQFALLEVDKGSAALDLLHELTDIMPGGVPSMDMVSPNHVWLLVEGLPPVTPPAIAHQTYRVEVDSGATELLAERTEIADVTFFRGLVLQSGPTLDIPLLDPFSLSLFMILLLGAAIFMLRRRL